MNAPVHPPVAPPEVDAGPGPGGAVCLLRRLMFDPVGMIEDFQRRHGQVFTIPVPFGLTPPFTFLTTRQGYGAVLNLPPTVGKNGPIIDRVPALATWTPRSDASAEHLQTLLLTGRRFIGARLRERSPKELEGIVRRGARRHMARWMGTVDLAEVMVAAIHDISARVLLGDDLWEALGEDAPALVRTVVNAVDAARAAVALSPAARLLPEHRATKELSKRFMTLANDPAADRFSFVAGLRRLDRDGERFPPEDLAWMMFFALWNATLYTGTYGLWSFLDWVDHPDLAALVTDPSPERGDLLVGGALETMRLNPISWQLRALASPVTVQSEGRSYRVPAGHFLSVFSHGLNREAATYPDPLAWRPRRYVEGAPMPLLFGTGPFSCVAQRWVKLLIATLHEEIFDRFTVSLCAPLPRRQSRVHLLYPNEPVLARVRRRDSS